MSEAKKKLAIKALKKKRKGSKALTQSEIDFNKGIEPKTVSKTLQGRAMNRVGTLSTSDLKKFLEK